MPNFPILSLPGIKRDTTHLNGNFYTDGQWCRFQDGKPRKMGGYQQISSELAGISRGIYAYPSEDTTGVVNIYSGSANALEYVQTSANGTGGGIFDRTPSALVNDPNNMWQFDAMYDANSTENRIIAHAAPNLSDINSQTETDVWYGDSTTTAPLTSTGVAVSGGIVALHPYLFYYGNNGFLQWSQANSPSVITGGDSGSARVTSNKIVRGMAIRGGTTPSGLFWSLDSVIKATYIGGDAVFQFQTLVNNTSILSSQCVVEYNGVFYWCTQDRFVFYTGVVRDLPNQMNVNYFFENLNFAQQQKVWGVAVGRFGEIWWHFPSGNSLECDQVVIFNITNTTFQPSTWYDTALQRSAGYYSNRLPNPVMAEPNPNTEGEYPLWLHEKGTDQVVGLNSLAIFSFFETSVISFAAHGPDGKWIGQNRDVIVERIEPDLRQVGNMNVIVKGKKFARSPEIVSDPFLIEPTTEKVDMHEQRRQVRLRFESNTVGGYYEMGQTILELEPGDVRP